MSLILTVEILLLTLLVIVFKTTKKKLISVKYSMMWILTMLLMSIITLAPKLLEKLSNLIGFGLVSNMLFLIGFLILFVIAFVLTVLVSVQKSEITILIQEQGILKSQIETMKKDICTGLGEKLKNDII